MPTETHIPLSEMQRKNAFAVPESYFEKLPMAVLFKCSESKVKKEPLRPSKPLWWSVAACVVLLLGIWFVIPNSTSPLVSLSADEELIQVVDNLQDYLTCCISSTVLEDELFLADIGTTLTPNFTQEEVLAYLDNYDIMGIMNW